MVGFQPGAGYVDTLGYVPINNSFLLIYTLLYSKYPSSPSISLGFSSALAVSCAPTKYIPTCYHHCIGECKPDIMIYLVTVLWRRVVYSSTRPSTFASIASPRVRYNQLTLGLYQGLLMVIYRVTQYLPLLTPASGGPEISKMYFNKNQFNITFFK